MKAIVFSLALLAGCAGASEREVSLEQEIEFKAEVTKILSIIDHPCHQIADGPYVVRFQAVGARLSKLQNDLAGSPLQASMEQGIEEWKDSEEYNSLYECMSWQESELRSQNDADLQSIEVSFTKLEEIASSMLQQEAE